MHAHNTLERAGAVRSNGATYRRVSTLLFALLAVIASSIAIFAPAASAETVTEASPICPDGGSVVMAEGTGVWCARPASGPTADGTLVPCPAPSKPASELVRDESLIIGQNQLFSDGACYYDWSCPVGYSPSSLAATGPAFVAVSCNPSDPSFRHPRTAEECVATDTVAAQWFPDVKQCGVPITPPALLDGVSTPLMDCTVVGGSYSAEHGCTLSVFRNDAGPEPTIPPPDPQPTTPPPTSTPADPQPTTPPPDPQPTSTPDVAVDPVPTATPEHPGFGFTG